MVESHPAWSNFNINDECQNKHLNILLPLIRYQMLLLSISSCELEKSGMNSQIKYFSYTMNQIISRYNMALALMRMRGLAAGWPDRILNFITARMGQ